MIGDKYYEVVFQNNGLVVREKTVEKETPLFVYFKGDSWRKRKSELRRRYGKTARGAVRLFISRWAIELISYQDQVDRCRSHISQAAELLRNVKP